MTLHDDKTGRHWPCTGHMDADRKAVRFGLKDYHVTADDQAPATIRETTDEMRRRARHPVTTIGE